MTKIGTYTNYPGAVVTIDVYDNFNGSNSLTGLLGSISAQTCTYTGYTTFDFSSPISIRYQTTGYNFPVPVEVAITGFSNPNIETGIFWSKSTGASTWGSEDVYQNDPCVYSYSTNIIDVTFTDGSTYSPPDAIPETDDNPIGQFKLAGLTTGATLTAVTMSFSGTATNITGVKLWNSSDNIFANGTQIGSTQSYNTSVSFSGLSSSISTSGTYYFVSFDLGESNGSVTTTIANNAAISISDGNLTSTINNAQLSSDVVPVPVELTSFSSKILQSGGIKLKWRTETEVNNFGFEVERIQRAENNDLWKKIGFVEGNGNSNSPKEYFFIDKDIIGGKYSYRLRQIDNDGTYEYSDEIEVVIIPTIFYIAQNYPNPFNPKTVLRYQIPKSSKVTIKIYDMLGIEVGTLVNELKDAGAYEVVFDASNYSSGIYIYRLQAGSFVETKKMVLLK